MVGDAAASRAGGARRLEALGAVDGVAVVPLALRRDGIVALGGDALVGGDVGGGHGLAAATAVAWTVADGAAAEAVVDAGVAALGLRGAQRPDLACVSVPDGDVGADGVPFADAVGRARGVALAVALEVAAVHLAVGARAAYSGEPAGLPLRTVVVV